MSAGLLEGVSRRGLALLVLLLAALLAAPWMTNDYMLTVLITILYFAYVGQAWNVMMGFAGQLSLGHAIYVGLGAYTSAALCVHYGVGPWIGLLAAIPVAMACGAIIGFLAFRFGVAGVYFADMFAKSYGYCSRTFLAVWNAYPPQMQATTSRDAFDANRAGR